MKTNVVRVLYFIDGGPGRSDSITYTIVELLVFWQAGVDYPPVSRWQESPCPPGRRRMLGLVLRRPGPPPGVCVGLACVNYFAAAMSV